MWHSGSFCREQKKDSDASGIHKATKNTPAFGTRVPERTFCVLRFGRAKYKTHHVRTTFGSCDVEKVHAVVARSTFPSQNVQKHTILGPLLEVQMSSPKTMAGMGHLKRICKDAFSVAGAVQKTCSWEMLGGQGADFLRGLHFGVSDVQVC